MLVEQLLGGLDGNLAGAGELVVFECCAAQFSAGLRAGVVCRGKGWAGHEELQALPEAGSLASRADSRRVCASEFVGVFSDQGIAVKLAGLHIPCANKAQFNFMVCIYFIAWAKAKLVSVVASGAVQGALET